MTFEAFSERFEKRTKTQHGFSVRCPAHADGTPSLSINRANDGGVLLKCFGGCPTESVVAALGLTMKDLFAKEAVKQFTLVYRTPETVSESKEKPVIEKIYSYQNELGVEVYQALRMKPKSFRQRHKNESWQWVWTMDGVTRVLYHLPEVLVAQEVWIVEGEKDADNLAELGFVTTCNVGGAGKWLDGYTESLKGKDVVICGDNDEPGQKHAELVFDSIAGVAKSVKIVKVPHPSKDASDHIATFKTKEEAKKSFEEIRDSAHPHIRGFKMPLYSMAEMESNYRRHAKSVLDNCLDLSKWLAPLKAIRPLVPGELVFIIGDTGSGKCLGKGTPVMMFDGSVVPVENIKAGDLLMGPDSKQKCVTGTCVGRENMYRVNQGNGDDFECNESHILSLQTTSNPSRGLVPGNTVNISVRDYLSKNHEFKHTHKGYKSGVEFSVKPLPIEPYFLGLWLGDGNSSDVAVTTGDEEIKKYLQSFSVRHSLRMRFDKWHGCQTICMSHTPIQAGNCKDGDCQKKSVSGGYCAPHYTKHLKTGFSSKKFHGTNVLEILRSIGVYKNKHIPHIFLCNSRKNQLSLLAGLIDSDGYSGKTGVCFCNTNERLARDVLFLCRSLGFKCSLCKKKTQIKSIGYVGSAWVVRIRGNVSDIPCLLKRKIGTDSSKYKNLLYGIKVSPVGEGEYYGFQLDGDGLFLLGDFTVTHNTGLIQSIAKIALPIPTLLFELELPPELLYERFVANARNMKCRDVEEAYRNGDEMGEALDVYFKNLLICTESRMTVEDLEHYIIHSELKLGRKPKVVLIDYIQLMQASSSANRREKVSDIAEALKVIAKKTKTVIICTSQVRRPSDEDPEIGLHSAKESGSIENSCGVLIGAWRDMKDKTLLWLKVLKSTKGGAGLLIPCDFIGSTMTIKYRPPEPEDQSSRGLFPDS